MAGISGLSVGVVLAGRYQLSKRLWHRSIGELWLASDTVRRRRVWIQISDTGGLENAVSALQRVQHPAISTVREAGQKRIAHEDRVVTDHDAHTHKLIHKSDSYIEFAVYDQDKGSSLTARLMKGALTSAEIASVALSVAEVFEQVHAAGLAHGWLHTDSIWLGAKGNIFVDLALGLAYDGDADSLAAESASGFISLERLAGEERVTAAADVYALSWLLYVCIFGWEIVRADLAQARVEALAALGNGGRVHGDGVSELVEVVELEETVTITTVTSYQLMMYRREIAVRRVVEFFGAESELALVFTNCLSHESGPRPSMAEVVTVLRGRQDEVAVLPVPAIVAEAIAASASFAFGAEAVADELAARVEDADTGAWTPAVSANAGRGKAAAAAAGVVAGAAIAGLVSIEDCEASRNEAVTVALAEAERRYEIRTEEAISIATAAAVAAAMAEAEAVHAEVDQQLVAAASATAIAEALAEAEERHAAERESAVALALAEHRSSTTELTDAAIEAAVAVALAEVEAAQAQANSEAVAVASAVAVEAALSEARAQFSVEFEESRAAALAELEERHAAELAEAHSGHGAAVAAASAAAVALAIEELEERHRAEILELREEYERAEFAMAGEASGSGDGDGAALEVATAAAVALAIAELEERHRTEILALREENERGEQERAEHGMAGEAATVAAVALAVAELEERHGGVIAELEERHRVEIAELRASQDAAREEAIGAACAAAVALALAEAEREHLAAVAVLEERHRSELAEAEQQGSGIGEAALAAASAAAVALALGEAEERHAAELAAARAESADTHVQPVPTGPVPAVMGAAAPPPSGPATPVTPGGEVPVPKQRPTWLIASGTAVVGLAVGIGIGWALHGGKSCTTVTAVVPNVGNSSSGASASAGASIPGSSASAAASSSSAGTATAVTASGATSANAGSPSGTPGGPVPTASGGASATASAGGAVSGSPSAAASSPSASASPSAGASSASPSAPASSPSAPSSPSTPATPYPTSAQQAESQMSDIVKQQVTNSNAAGQLNGAISSIKSTQPGSGAYNQAIGTLNGLVSTELNQGVISESTATALRQQVTYLLSFSGS